MNYEYIVCITTEHSTPLPATKCVEMPCEVCNIDLWVSPAACASGHRPICLECAASMGGADADDEVLT